MWDAENTGHEQFIFAVIILLMNFSLNKYYLTKFYKIFDLTSANKFVSVWLKRKNKLYS